MSQLEGVRNDIGFGLVFGDLGKVQGSGPLLCIDVGRKG